jgi:anthranilate phosphoribosyltransferase
LKADDVRTYQITPEEFGLKRVGMGAIAGGDAKQNADITRNILNGGEGPRMDMVLLNASAAFVAAGLCDDFTAGIDIAKDSIDSGKAREKLEKLIEMTQQCKPFFRDEASGA